MAASQRSSSSSVASPTGPPRNEASEARSRRYASTVRGERLAARRSRYRSTSESSLVSGREVTARANRIRGHCAGSSHEYARHPVSRRTVVAAGVAAGLLAMLLPAPAQASELIARNTASEWRARGYARRHLGRARAARLPAGERRRRAHESEMNALQRHMMRQSRVVATEALRPRVRAVVDAAQALRVDVAVDLRRREGGVAEELLDRP